MLSVLRKLPLIFLTTAIIAIFCFPRGLTALKCHNCISTDKSCEGSKECPAGNEFCLKSSAKAQGHEAVVKSCSPGGAGAKEGCSSADISGVKGTLCLCKGDNCNGGSSLKFWWGHGVIAGSASILLTLYSWRSS